MILTTKGDCLLQISYLGFNYQNDLVFEFGL